MPYQPDNIRAVNPYLLASDGDRLLRFLREVFDARELHLSRDPQGRLRHASVAIGDGTLMLGEPSGDGKAQPSSVYIYVPDVDAAYRRALAAGARSLYQPTTHDYGDRGCGVADADGNLWWIGTRV
jgi:uncharacterized glyoxalase superfamily protein PhnB